MPIRKLHRALCLVVLLGAMIAVPQPSRATEHFRALVEDAIRQGFLRDARVLAGTSRTILADEAYPAAIIPPASDLASLTKPVAVATAILRLAESGKLRITDPIGAFLPELGTLDVTLEELLRHRSGIPELSTIGSTWTDAPDRPTAVRRALELAARRALQQPLRKVHAYKDVNYFLLGLVAERAFSKGAERDFPLDTLTRLSVFVPLGMNDTGFRPGLPWKAEVSDPFSRSLGGVSGNAGLFSTATDLVRFARMLLQQGISEGGRLLSPESVARMTTRSPAFPDSSYGLGMDADPRSIRPPGFSPRSYGHTGYTGTSLLLDPERDLFVLILGRRNGGLEITTRMNQLRKNIAAKAATLGPAPAARIAER